MIQNPVTISPESTAMSAINLMLQHKIGCLPVVEGRVLVGLVTEHDFIRCSRDLIYEFNRKT